MTRIRRLPREVVDLIAAGEVLERPASAVKELVENALDAGARAVEVSIEGGGIESISVVDDGEGIAAEDLPLVVEPHATSKIEGRDDLGRIATYGFRGEALAALAAAADIEIVSRSASTRPPAGAAVLRRRDGRWVVEPAAGPPGTRVEARRLFARVPARRKFLRSARSEAAAVSGVIERYALARPDVRFVLVRDGRTALRTPGDGDVRRAAEAVWGRAAAGLVEVDGRAGALAVRGLVGTPDGARPSRALQAVAVNGRPVRDAVVAGGLSAAFEGLVARGLHPAAVLALEVPPGDVDPNVHPAKAEVRFREPAAVRDLVRRTVLARLRSARPVAVWSEPVVHEGPAPDNFNESSTGGGGVEKSLKLSGAGPLEIGRLVYRGTLGARYLIAEEREALVLVDAHAAHERVLFDRLRRAAGEGRPPVQPLLVPIRLDVRPEEEEALEAHRADLAEVGVEVAPFGPRAWTVSAVPAALAGADPAALVREVLAGLVARGSADPRPVSDLIARRACRSAVKSGAPLGATEAAALLAALERSDDPVRCPHGRPTVVRLPLAEIDRRFGRS